MPYISPKDVAALARNAAPEPPEPTTTDNTTTMLTTSTSSTPAPLVATPAPMSHADELSDSPGLTSCGTTDSSSSVRTLSSDSAGMATLGDKLDAVHIEDTQPEPAVAVAGDDDDEFAPCPIAVASYHAGLYAFTKPLYDEARGAAQPKPKHRLAQTGTVPVA